MLIVIHVHHRNNNRRNNRHSASIVLILNGFLPNEIVKDSRNFWTKSEFNGVLKAFTLAFFLKATILEFSNLSVSADALSKIKKPCSVI